MEAYGTKEQWYAACDEWEARSAAWAKAQSDKEAAEREQRRSKVMQASSAKGASAKGASAKGAKGLPPPKPAQKPMMYVFDVRNNAQKFESIG